MSRRIGWTLPLLVGVLVCLAGCTFPKSFGFARKQEPQRQTQVAEDHPTATQNTAEATAPKSSLAQTFRKTTNWFSFARHKPASTSDQPLVDKNDPSKNDLNRTASQPLAYPNVVPPKYRNMGTGVPPTSLAQDTSGTPSLVRPSRRPPPDPAPKPPQEELPAEKPRAEGPLYDIIAAASQSWRVGPRNAAVAASANAAARQLATETQLKFTSPDRSARERQAVTKPTDIVTNMLRPAKSAPRTADKPTPTSVARTEAIRRAESNCAARARHELDCQENVTLVSGAQCIDAHRASRSEADFRDGRRAWEPCYLERRGQHVWRCGRQIERGSPSLARGRTGSGSRDQTNSRWSSEHCGEAGDEAVEQLG